MTPIIAPSIRCDIKSDHGRVFENAPAKTRMQEVPQDAWQVIGIQVAAIVTTAELAAREVLMMGSTCKGLHQASHAPAIQRVITQAKNEDDALLKIWTKISGNLNFNGNPPPQTLVEIKAWFEDPTNADQLNAITDLALDELQLKAIPPQITKFTQLKSLDLSNNQIRDISALKGLNQLKTLSLHDNQIADISVLRGLTQLKTLSLENNQIVDISALRGFTELETLALDDNQIVDISALRGLNQLKTLCIRDNQIVDISALRELTQLKYLYLENNQIVDISVLRGLNQLKTLRLRNNQIADISALSGLTLLKTLSLDNNQIVDISVLRGLTLLKTLSLDNNQIVDISVLRGLTQLKILSLEDNLIVDISALRGLTQLETLRVCNNRIVDISALSGLALLSILLLADNQIADISALVGLTQLNLISLHNNQIVDISALMGLTQLTLLYLHNNQIVDISALGGLTRLSNLNLSRNPITDITSLMELTELQRVQIDAHSLLCVFNDDYLGVWSRSELDVIVETNIAFRDYSCQSSLSRFVQFLALGNPSLEAVKKQFDTLDDSDKNLIYALVSQASAVMTDDPNWGEHHAFDDKIVLVQAVRKAIRTKFKQLSQDQKNQVYGEVYKLAGSPQTKDSQQWGERHAFDNVLRLIDAMKTLDQQFLAFPA